MKSDNYVVIFGWMCNELNLKGTDLLVYALIYGISQDGKSKFSAGRNYIAETFNVSLPTVDKALQNLIDQNLIIKEPCKNQSETDKYFANISSKEILLPQNISSKETLPDNKYISIKTENNINNQQELFTDNNKEVLEVRKNAGQKFVEDYNSICKSLPKCTRVTTKRSKGISNLLRKYSYDDILTVFNKLEASDFCTGKVNGWRADIDFILREDKFVSALEGKYDNKGRKCNVETISSNGPKYRVSAEEKEEMRRAVERGELKEY